MKQMKWAVLALATGLAVSPLWAEDAAGDWGGQLLGKLRLVVRLKADGNGQWTGNMESLDQGNAVLPLADIRATPDQLQFAAPQVNGQYKGQWDAEKKAWVGTWQQGQPLALTLTRLHAAGDNPALPKLPKLPKRPQEEAIVSANGPHTAQDVTFDNQAAGVRLAGTFSAPAGRGPFAAVLLIAGSGPNTRDEEVLGHKVFLVLADALNRAGIAVLRYDKRGIGASTGNIALATSEDFASDARAALAYLCTRADVDALRLGLLGHSEGGVIAPIVAADDAGVRFVVLLAGSSVNGQRVLLSQKALIMRASGQSESQVEKAVRFNQKMFDMVVRSQTALDAQQQLKAHFEPMVAGHDMSQQQADQLIAQLTSPWMRYFLRYDPAPTLRKVTVPVLALNGALDLQVEPVENLGVIRLALAGNKDATVVEMPGLNHLFQTAKTGSPSEYADIEETMSPAALDTITAWVASHAKP